MAQVAAADVSPGRTRLRHTSARVGIVVNKVEVLILPVLLKYVQTTSIIHIMCCRGLICNNTTRRAHSTLATEKTGVVAIN
jgi:hypothetical protein